MKFFLLLTGLMVGLPKSSLEPGRIFTSRNDGPTHVIKFVMFAFSSAVVSALNILLGPIAPTMADKSIFFAATCHKICDVCF